MAAGLAGTCEGCTGDVSAGTGGGCALVTGSPLDRPADWGRLAVSICLDESVAGGAGSCLDLKCLFRRTRAVEALPGSPSVLSSTSLDLSRSCCCLSSYPNR